MLRIVDLKSLNPLQLEQAAQVLMKAFVDMAPDDWNTVEEAMEEVQECLDPERIGRAALIDDVVVGWIGGIPTYNGHVWELHPLAVDPSAHGQGIGRALAIDFEEQVAAQGGLTIMLGTDDQPGWTSIADVDLYPDPLKKLADIQNIKRHPFEFYRKLGYALVGVIPDANGIGKPDILMAKKVNFVR